MPLSGIVLNGRRKQSQLAHDSGWPCAPQAFARAPGLDFLRCVPPSIVVDDHGALHLVRANRWGSAGLTSVSPKPLMVLPEISGQSRI